ncbi:MAG: CotH kinase family protein [Crocinitomicaceae bacterium]|nr:CotH kinase family protein [Crocinitomicaceae bacterium]
MLKKLKVDRLLLFFTLSITLLLVSWHAGLVSFSEEHPEKFPQELVLENNLKIEYRDQEISSFSTYNPSNFIYYSVDGGDHFVEAGNSLPTSTIRSNNVKNIPSSVRWRPSAANVKEVKSVMIFVIDPNKKVKSENQTFIVDPILKEGSALYISGSQQGFFDEVEGLLVDGKSSWNDQGFYKSWYYRNANYMERGIEWEREVNIQLERNGKIEFDQNCGIRISGNATRGFPQKSFRIYARNQYGAGQFKFRFFGEKGLKKYESLVIRHSGNDNTETMFADLLMQNLAEGSKVLVQKGEPVTVFLNGNYWGEYNLRERIDRNYIAGYHKCKREDVTIVDGGNFELKSGGEKKQKELIDNISGWSKSEEVNNEMYEEIKNEISLKSFMDYLFFETYFGNNDWPLNNVTMYHIKNDQWYFALNDLDYSLAYPGESNIEFNAFKKLDNSASNFGKLFQLMMKSEDFKEKFKDRARKNVEKFLNESRVLNEYEKLKLTYELKIQNEIDRWRSIESKEIWETNCQKNLKYLLDRKVVYLKQIEEL